MDEKTQYNCDKIFNISNHIHNCIKNSISPLGNRVDYTSVKSIWTSFIGLNVTLSQEEFNLLNIKCKHMRNLLDRIEYILCGINHLNGFDKDKQIHYINNNVGLFDIYLDEFNIMMDNINNDIQNLKNKNVTYSRIIPEKDNIIKGTKWINILFSFYLKYDGIKNVSTSEFFYHINSIWDKINISESIEISDIMDNILGGSSIMTISYNLLDWIKKNGDSLPVNYKDIINISLEPEIRIKRRERNTIEFNPNDYFILTSDSEDLTLKV